MPIFKFAAAVISLSAPHANGASEVTCELKRVMITSGAASTPAVCEVAGRSLQGFLADRQPITSAIFSATIDGKPSTFEERLGSCTVRSLSPVSCEEARNLLKARGMNLQKLDDEDLNYLARATRVKVPSGSRLYKSVGSSHSLAGAEFVTLGGGIANPSDGERSCHLHTF